MKDITIDCRGFGLRSDLHRTFAHALSLPEHYGNNLDALHDCLTDIQEPTRIRLLYWSDAEESLGNYARSTKRALADAMIRNMSLSIVFE